MNSKVKYIIGCFLIFSFTASAKENVIFPGATTVVYPKVAAGCTPSNSQTDLDINNIRTTIMGGGDMWWNLDDARYEIPKDGNRHSMFAGALWIGGIDAGANLKIAAMTYRQGGNDFWPGPLVESGVNIGITDDVSCNAWDQHFKINRSEVEEHVDKWNTDDAYRTDPSAYPDVITNWPAHPSQVSGTIAGADFYLAPFYDHNSDGVYWPGDGDYPDYNISGDNDLAKLFGDQTLFWIFNDKGNIHTESEAAPLGLEIHAQAFGFTSDNEVNDMTFYNYKIINRSTIPIMNTYFGQWVDPDLGFYLDDYVGCDVNLGLGFCYNGDAEDEGANGYGYTPPAIGVDFFQGPLADENDGIDNDRDGVIDEVGEEIIMSKFVYYNNDFSVIGNPSSGNHFYNYLQGIWKDNVPMTYGGDGHGSGQGATTDLCNFMFPGTSDPDFPNDEWTEVTAGNQPADRRFLQSAGPFKLNPGAVNEITTGVVWARATSGGNTASIALVKIYDKEAQALFDNNFNILNGPDAPDLNVRELDQELIFTLSNQASSNNAIIDSVTGFLLTETYSEKDPYIIKTGPPYNHNPNYEFQGYLVYQLKDATVTQTDLDNPDKARLIFRSDIEDTVSGIINQYLDPSLGVYTPIEEVSSVLDQGTLGSVDRGVQYSFKIVNDKFALGDPTLVNHKTYYFMSLAYGYNRDEENADPYNVNAFDYDGRNRPFISSRRNIKVYSAIPHFIEPERGGTVLNADYGDGFNITRLEGKGNGGHAIDLNDASIDQIFNSTNHRVLHPEYKSGLGPVAIKVVDPTKIKGGDYTFQLGDPIFSPPLTSSNPPYRVIGYNAWSLLDNSTNKVVASSNQSIDLSQNKYIDKLGISVEIKQASSAGENPLINDENGLISASIEFEDENGMESSERWLSGLPDRDDESGFFYGLNWIRAGSYSSTASALLSDYNQSEDPNGVYEGLIQQTKSWTVQTPFGTFPLEFSGGTWAPYRFVSAFRDAPGFQKNVHTSYVKLDQLHSVDVVFTPDTSKWSRCIVLEAQDDPSLAIGGAGKMDVRRSPSVDKCGLPDPNAPDLMGWGWFPGYAIDVETGERLNIMFSEDSWLTDENGADMIWNPTSNVATLDQPEFDATSNTFSGGSYLLGGKHFIYVVRGESWVKGTEQYVGASSGTGYFGYDILSLPAPNNNPWKHVDFSPNYDECKWISGQFSTGIGGKYNVFKNVSWTNIPMLQASNTNLLDPCEGLVPSVAKVKLRVGKKYMPYESVDPMDILSRMLPSRESSPTNAENSYSEPLRIGDVYCVAYQNNTTTWGGHPIKHACQIYYPGDFFIARDTLFEGYKPPPGSNNTANKKSRVIDCNYSFNFNSNIKNALISLEAVLQSSNPYSCSNPLINNPSYSVQIDAFGVPFLDSLQEVVINDSLVKFKASNRFNPRYSFNTDDKVVEFNNNSTAVSALDMINVVPNPYYGYSEYETNQLDNRIKITNLPRKATISIFTISGTLIRRLKKDDNVTSIDWDLKNDYGVPIASGLYVLHIKTKHGEKILKWFGALRPMDLDTF